MIQFRFLLASLLPFCIASGALAADANNGNSLRRREAPSEVITSRGTDSEIIVSGHTNAIDKSQRNTNKDDDDGDDKVTKTLNIKSSLYFSFQKSSDPTRHGRDINTPPTGKEVQDAILATHQFFDKHLQYYLGTDYDSFDMIDPQSNKTPSFQRKGDGFDYELDFVAQIVVSKKSSSRKSLSKSMVNRLLGRANFNHFISSYLRHTNGRFSKTTKVFFRGVA